MPKKKIINRNEPVSARPHRNMKAKVVFDPSDNHIPKKRAKYSYKSEKPPVEATTVKKTTKDKRKKKKTTKSKSLPVKPVTEVTEVTELLDCPSTEINTISLKHSPISSPVNSVIDEVIREISKNCCICSTVTENMDLIDCPICLITAHKQCIIINEPVWKFKLDYSPWLCGQCRKQNCSKCLKDESQSMIKRRCITCEVGLHTHCYESYDIKPLHKLESDNMYVCIPCMTLATQVNPEEEDDDVVEPVKFEEDDVQSIISSIVSISSDEVDTDSKSNRSDCSTDYEKYVEIKNPNIPNISKWTKIQVFEYLSEHLPQEIIVQIMRLDLDGRALQLLQREDIISKMGLKLGCALKLYKQVRILQSQSTHNRIFWE